jgi:hypothetical protein
MQETIPWILGCVAAIIHAVGYIQYNRQSKKGASEPNPVSWFIWASMAGLNLMTFAGFTSIPHALQYIVGTISAIATFILALVWGKFDRPNFRELSVLIVCIATLVVWWIFRSASVGNVILMIAFLISVEPTFTKVRKNPHAETSTAWKIWVMAFVVNLANNAITLVFGEPNPDVTLIDQIMSVANPIIILSIHALIAFMCRQARKDQFPRPNPQA